MRFHAFAALAGFALFQTGMNVCAQAPAPNRVELVDRIVAVVNSEVITSREVAERVRSVIQQLRQQGTQLPPADVIEKQVTERMIMDRLQLQLAKETAE